MGVPSASSSSPAPTSWHSTALAGAPDQKVDGATYIENVVPPPQSPTSKLNDPESGLAPLSELLDLEEEPIPDRLWTMKGMSLLVVTGTAQLLDNLLLTAVNISLPAMSRSLHIEASSTSWIMSAYALAFGGFLLLAGVMADRYGRKRVFELGMAWLTLWTLLVSFAPNKVAAIVFRAMQGLGAAASVPAAVGILSQYFNSRERNTALCIFGAAGAVGFSSGLVFGGIIQAFLNWQWIFRISAMLVGAITLAGVFVLPPDAEVEGPKPAMDFMGAGLGTGGLVLLVFCLSSGGIYGWGKARSLLLAFIIAVLIVSVLMLVAFTYAEKKVKNPLMPLMLWRAPNFGVSWVCGLLLYCWWQSVVYYMVLIAQNVHHLSAIQTALRFMPIGIISFPICVCGGWYIQRFPLKMLIMFSMIGCVVSVIPAAVMTIKSDFWTHLFITSILGSIFISLSYSVLNLALISAVPPSAQGLAGGLANTSYQLGSGIGLAVTAAVQQAVSKGVDPHSPAGLLAAYKACLWTTGGMAGMGFVLVALFLRNLTPMSRGPVTVH
ncbi:MFS general substrate transporter [Punctularia strigosozonata HHB-11173 SS5]|uniref:MFS general substrate transporter n=1 Tax=Punctularia strigosozonata (strain HHB-11173) TaxID=741275 RepID=UPI0004417106|nr:MFS general substrate transporter [Punctularia strigosozonata HHB-11173 SS5]EIN13180.1 MFS general substrate transporter [Punctularia strigosozonata HHB-11173 SS5]